MTKLTTFKSFIAILLVQSIALPALLFAQQAQPAADDINARIRKEEMENSKIMHTLHIFTDLYGPRLTGSPNHVNAAKWAAAEMKSWGFDHTALEPWNFGHPGWVNERNTGLLITPVQDTLTYEVLAWTPSTNGPVTADAVQIIPPKEATQEELDAYLASVKSEVGGKIVLVGKHAFIDQSLTPPAKRLEDEVVRKRYDPNAERQQFPRRQPGPAPKAGALSARQVNEQIDKFLLDNKALVRIN